MGADQYWEEARFGRDVYYHVVTQEEREERTRAQTRGKKRGVTVRSIKNPHYADATVAEVMERLRDRQDGDFLFSPEVRTSACLPNIINCTHVYMFTCTNCHLCAYIHNTIHMLLLLENVPREYGNAHL